MSTELQPVNYNEIFFHFFSKWKSYATFTAPTSMQKMPGFVASDDVIRVADSRQKSWSLSIKTEAGLWWIIFLNLEWSEVCHTQHKWPFTVKIKALTTVVDVSICTVNGHACLTSIRRKMYFTRWCVDIFSRTAERFAITEISSGFYLPNYWNWLIFDWAIRKIKMSVFETRFVPMRFELLSEIICAVDTLQCSEDFTVGDGREVGRRSRSSQTVAASNRVGRWKDDG